MAYGAILGQKAGLVDSVNGKTGKVELTAEDVKAAPEYSYGTEDIGVGAPLKTGVMYLVYQD